MLSILIPTYNYNIEALVSELHAQSSACNIDFEILCYDDSSTNLEIIASNKTINLLKNTTYKFLDTNIGRSSIRNLLAKNAKFDLLLFLDADDNGNGKPISQIPLCIVTMWYLFSYILTIIGTENIWGDNIPVIVILGLISIFYTGWFVNRSDCVDNFFTDENKDTFLIWFKPVIIGSLCGFLWALYISAINIAELKYFAGLTKDERCSRPKRALYKCEFKNPV